MSRSKSSKQWLREHFTDNYVKLAQKQGYRSRAVYKLLEIQQREHILCPGMTVVDLGAAPGSWSELAAQLITTSGRVIAVDILPMQPIDNVKFIHGDFTTEEILFKLVGAKRQSSARYIDVVLSDMAPNMSGIMTVDQTKAIYLAELAWDFAVQYLKVGGHLVMKIFQGSGTDELIRAIRPYFNVVKFLKPAASRSRSREFYLLAKQFKLIQKK